VQRLLVVQLADIVGAGRVAVQTPNDLEQVLPFVRVMRIGGGRDWVNDMATVDVDVFAASYTAAEVLATQIDDWLCGPPPGPAELDRVICEVAPRELPWSDLVSVRRWASTYQVVSRRRAA
jgi:hypothetical protein